jgi:hypothetical protein
VNNANRFGCNNSNWKGGRLIQKIGHVEYVRIYRPSHPRAIDKYVMEHILVAEKINGGPLPVGAVVHHRDGNGLNNKEDNLQIFKNQSEHARFHMALRNKVVCERDHDVWYATGWIPNIGKVYQCGKTKEEAERKIYKLVKDIKKGAK